MEKQIVACSYGYKLECVDDKLSKPFQSYLDKDSINSMIEESKYCSAVVKKYFSKKLVMTNEDDEDFENSTKSWICDNSYVDGDAKVRNHCPITGKYKRCVH